MKLPPDLQRVLTDYEAAWAYRDAGALATAGKPDDGKFTLTLRKDSDGRWLIVSDMDSSNRRRE